MDIEVKILDQNLRVIGILDTFESFIWTDRFYTHGDFEVHMIMDDFWYNLLKPKNYLQCNLSDRLMIITKIVITTDVEEGSMLVVYGKSLEFILTQRIAWGQKTMNGNFQNEVETLLNESIINPTDLDRKIGYRIVLNDNGQFVFQWVLGTDRSFDQLVNSYVVFSPKYDNLINSSYTESMDTYKNVILVGGEGEGSARVYATVGTASGLDRKEHFANASDISSDVGNHKVLTPTEYQAVLQQRGTELLASSELRYLTLFDGSIETNELYKYREDFFMGDIIQFENEYGHEGRVRIIELIISVDRSGFAIYPTYTTEE